jgi:hypothetical protein
MARKKELETDTPVAPPNADDLARLLLENEALDPFDEAARQRLSKVIAETATRRTKKKRQRD